MTTTQDIQQEFIDMLNDDFFGEDIVYSHEGTEYDIRAFVYRKGVAQKTMRFDRGSESMPNRYDIEIRISSDSTYGISDVTIRTDYVKVAKDISGKIITMRVAEIIGQDQGTWKLGLSV